LTPGATSLEPAERIEPVVVTLEEAIDLVRKGAIRDGKTIATLLYYVLAAR
jgi:hypothetical protein